MVERTRQLWAEGYADLQIADILSREGFRSAQRETVLAKTIMKIRHRHQWVSPYHQHRLVDKMDEQWTIRGLARELGVEWGWVYNRIRNGFLSEPDVSRRPPHGNVLIRDDAEVLTRLRVEVTRSHRLRKNASTPSIPPDPGGGSGQSVQSGWSAWGMRLRGNCVVNCAMTSRTNRTLKGAKSDVSGDDHESCSGTAAKTGRRAVSGGGQNRS